MKSFFALMGDFFADIIETLNRCTLNIIGEEVGLASIYFVFMTLGLIISVFWRGTKT